MVDFGPGDVAVCSRAHPLSPCLEGLRTPLSVPREVLRGAVVPVLEVRVNEGLFRGCYFEKEYWFAYDHFTKATMTANEYLQRCY